MTAPIDLAGPTPRSDHRCSGRQMLGVSNPTRPHKRHAQFRYQTGHALNCSPTHPRSGHRDNRTANINRRTGHSRRSPTAPTVRTSSHRPDDTAAQVFIAWSHPGRCRNEAAFARLAGVAPLQASLASGVATHPPPAQPLRRPPTQPSHPHHRHHPRSGLPQNPGLHRQTHQPRKNHPRSPTLPQTVHRPPPLPTPPKPAPNPGRTSPTVPLGNAATPPQAQNPTPRQDPDLENIEASRCRRTNKAPIRSHSLPGSVTPALRPRTGRQIWGKAHGQFLDESDPSQPKNRPYQYECFLMSTCTSSPGQSLT